LKTPPSVQKQCQRCLSVIGRGKSHICTPSTQAQNLKALAEKFPIGSERIASSIIKKKQASPGGTIRLSQFVGPLFPVMPCSSSSIQKSKSCLLSTENMISIQQATNLSNTNTRRLASCLNKFTPKGSGVEAYFQKKFSTAGKSVEEFFHSASESFDCKGNLEERSVVLCKDLEEFVWHVLKSRLLNYLELRSFSSLGLLRTSLKTTRTCPNS